MRDKLGRRITYLRLSVTDRCNLRCRYCSPSTDFRHLPRAEILSYEEMERIVSLCASRGIGKVRLTGGEPLMRRGVIRFAARLAALPGIHTLAMSTNGTLLAPAASRLAEAGVRRLNVSVDTLDRRQFTALAGRDALADVLAGVDAALAAGLESVKINSVILRGFNESQIVPLAGLTLSRPLQLRFIERMPLQPGDRGGGNDGGQEGFVSCDEVVDVLRKRFRMREAARGATLSRRFIIDGHAGEIGIIAPMSKNFCLDCNRLRLTADGQLRPCLFSEAEIDLRGSMRDGASDAEILELIGQAVAAKPASHPYSVESSCSPARPMRQIGG